MIHWNSLQDFLAMGGYGLYVWGSFAVTALAILIEVIVLRRSHRELCNNLTEQLNSSERTWAE